MVFIWHVFHPEPAPPGFAQGRAIPEQQASIWSQTWLGWVFPFLRVGYSRPLQQDDLWQVNDFQRAHHLGDILQANYADRKRKRALKRASKTANPDAAGTDHTETAAQDESTSLVLALYSTLKTIVWVSGLLKLVADVLTVTAPILFILLGLLNWLTLAYFHHRTPDETPAPRPVGYGVGLAVILFLMQALASMCEYQSAWRTLSAGIMMRTGVSSNLFRKSLKLSNRARLIHSKGQITTMLSEDAPRLEQTLYLGHLVWLAPLQVIIAMALIIRLLGYSALVGLAMLIIMAPIQMVLVSMYHTAMRKNLVVTDHRVRLMQEVLQGIRSVKMYAWEDFFGHKISTFRQHEIGLIRRSALVMALTTGVMTLIPVLCCTMTFITYSLTGHALTPATIFAALQLFNILRMPLIMFPVSISVLAQARASVIRMATFLDAEEAPPPFEVHKDSDVAVDIDGDFAWEEDVEEEDPRKKEKDKTKDYAKEKDAKGFFSRFGLGGKKRSKGKEKEKDADAETIAGEDAEKKKTSEPFAIRDLRLQVHKGEFVAIVGSVGAGKTSLLQALAGEMRKTRGNVILSGQVAYVPQIPWIINATVKENILFGEPEDNARYQQVIKTCSLQQDLDMLQYGDRTEIGEKGINLSGGQRACVSLARAAYSRADIVLFDDPISALDAHVGKAILDNCLVNGPLSDRTRILVTHALHVLPHVDYVYVFDRGRIVEQGHFKELLANGGELSRIIDEFGTSESTLGKPKSSDNADEAGEDTKDAADALMQDEDRAVGGVQLSTYLKYFDAAGGALAWITWLIVVLTITQAAQVANTLFLGFWTSRSIHGLRNGHYMAIYVGVGIVQAILQTIASFTWAIAALRASFALFSGALEHVMGSPVSFFDTTPMGRIVSRLTRDVAELDMQLWQLFDNFSQIFFTVFGTIALVFYVFPYLGIIFAPLILLYYLLLVFYRRNSVEVKRLESVLRSSLYSSYIETMNGISTVRATRSENRFIVKTERAIDDQNRASYMTRAIMAWLGIFLTLMGNLLILGIGLFAVAQRTSVDPSRVGVVLSYTMSSTCPHVSIVTSFADVEQGMNNVERVIAFNELPAEGSSIPDQKPAPPSWPTAGTVVFKNVTMAYREGLLDVLQGVNFILNAGEKVGIVGRTGAGKSSLIQALLRFVEIRSGSIEVDDINIQSVDMPSLRFGLSVIPQDSLFLGTLRENICISDPLNTRTDAELLRILRKAHLLPPPGKSDPVAEARFTLDASLGQEGVSLSAGEKQQVALCRVLVKNSKIIILDEATSSVDVEKDAKLQLTIRNELVSSTLLCIAHRLNTIAYYDRVLVMDRGSVAEFDPPLVLFDREDSIFRGLCDEVGLTRADIIRIRAQGSGAVEGSSS
ncbi:cadmium ion transporter [Auricularia subglabra TFB-10046 SS5]|nr:cadmium ion transporter [Auricularia subglabra TFB-10046 SS5]